jgi:hypothetical protein
VLDYVTQSTEIECAFVPVTKKHAAAPDSDLRLHVGQLTGTLVVSGSHCDTLCSQNADQ